MKWRSIVPEHCSSGLSLIADDHLGPSRHPAGLVGSSAPIAHSAQHGGPLPRESELDPKGAEGAFVKQGHRL